MVTVNNLPQDVLLDHHLFLLSLAMSLAAGRHRRYSGYLMLNSVICGDPAAVSDD